jgi:hypothetical protein
MLLTHTPPLLTHKPPPLTHKPPPLTQRPMDRGSPPQGFVLDLDETLYTTFVTNAVKADLTDMPPISLSSAEVNADGWYGWMRYRVLVAASFLLKCGVVAGLHMVCISFWCAGE